MQLDGSWYANGLADKDNTTILPFPTIPGGKKSPTDIISGFSSGFYITEKAWKNPEVREMAVNYVMFHTTSSSIARYWWGAGSPASQCITPVGMQSLLNDGAEMASAATGMDAAIDSRMSPDAWRYLIESIDDISRGKASVEDVLQQVVKLNKPR
jgi:raffinose/stachyose/melibiose transport system substrate-binding protein